MPGEVCQIGQSISPEAITDKGIFYHGIPADLQLKETLSALGIYLFSYDDVAMNEDMMLRTLNGLPL